MKTIASLLLVITLLLNFTIETKAQDQSPPFIVISQAHWDWDNDGNPERWLELEKAWFDNVIAKNEYIISSGVYHHHYTGDNSEVNFVTVYANWEDIPKANKRSAELAKAAWPDEEERKAAGKERNGYYTTMHSDEIYVGQPFVKPVSADVTEPSILLVVDRHLAFPDDGEDEEYNQLMTEFHTNVTHKNPHLLGFYVHRHAWGSDGRDLQLVFVVKSMDDIDDMQEAQGDLIDKHWPDEAKRKEFFKKLNKYFTPWHSDRIYETQPELMKSYTPSKELIDTEK